MLVFIASLTRLRGGNSVRRRQTNDVSFGRDVLVVRLSDILELVEAHTISVAKNTYASLLDDGSGTQVMVMSDFTFFFAHTFSCH